MSVGGSMISSPVVVRSAAQAAEGTMSNNSEVTIYFFIFGLLSITAFDSHYSDDIAIRGIIKSRKKRIVWTLERLKPEQ
jgi:hypothetical protein